MENLNGEFVKFIQDDSIVNYSQLRSQFSEQNCLDLIQTIKDRTGKKCAVFFGNCNIAAVRKFAIRNTQFNREYFILELPDDFYYDLQQYEFLFGGGGQVFQLVNLLVIQRSEKRNINWFFIPTDEIIAHCNSETKILTVPRQSFAGYFPQYFPSNPRDPMRIPIAKKFPIGDKFIFSIMERSEKNPDVEKILDRISDENFMPPAEIKAHVENSIAMMHVKERNCDIKIADYIEANYQDQQIFYSPGHPSQTIILELTRRILRQIGIKSDNFLRLSNLLNEKNFSVTMRGQDVPIYPCVLKFFDFQEHLETYWANRYVWDFFGNFREFYREYIRQCWDEKFTE